MDKELLFITVLGQDKKGIVARISGLLYESGVNIGGLSGTFIPVSEDAGMI